MSKKLKKTEAIDAKGNLWNKEKIQNLLLTNDEAVYKAMLRIYARQTEDEKQIMDTKDWNSVGFTGVDGHIMSSFVESYKRYGRLTEKQMRIARNKIKKYWRQLIDVIRSENPRLNIGQ